MLLNSAASAFTAREVQIAWDRLEGDMVRSVNELPEVERCLYCGAMYQASDIRFAQRVTWSLDRFFGRRDISIQPLSELSQPSPRSYLLIADERFVSEWCGIGWHPGGLPASRNPTSEILAGWKMDKSIDLRIQGWQIRGWHLMVLAKKIVKGTKTDLIPLGPTLYEAAFRFYRQASLPPLARTDLRPISIKEYGRELSAGGERKKYRLLDGEE